jgi:S-DNA-T family DNA segregation ATPase FtsK/SpoIIIE
VSQASFVLNELVGLMLARDREGVREPRVMVAIDEMADLVLAGGRGVGRSIMRLTQRGREAGVHVIACTQKPTVDAIGSLVKSNFPVRLVGSVASAEDAKVASGLAGTGAEKLLGRGDFLLVVKGEVVRFQAAYVSEGEVAAIVGKLRQGGRKSRRPEWLAGREAAEAELARTGTGVEVGNGRERQGLARVAQQLRLIK